MSDAPNNHDEPAAQPDETATTDTTATESDTAYEDSREKFAWALFALLTVYVLLHPFLPGYVPDPAIAGAIITGIIGLLVTHRLGV